MIKNSIEIRPTMDQADCTMESVAKYLSQQQIIDKEEFDTLLGIAGTNYASSNCTDLAKESQRITWLIFLQRIVNIEKNNPSMTLLEAISKASSDLQGETEDTTRRLFRTIRDRVIKARDRQN